MSRFVVRPEPTAIPTALWNDEPLLCLKVNTEWYSHILGVLVALDQQDTWIGDEDQIFAARQQVNEIMLAFMQSCRVEFQLFDDETPEILSADDTNAVELGMQFHTSVFGDVVGLRFYKGEDNTGTHTGHLFDDVGTLLGSVEFTDETASGWQMARFDTPIAIDACRNYTIAYHAPNGHYSYTRPFWTADVIVPPIHALEAHDDGSGNGVYDYGAAGTFPTSSYFRTNYWVDVIFVPTGADYAV